MILRGTIKDSFPRVVQDADLKRLKSFPILTLTGPRQSGKTTLARMLRPSFAYCSLEDPDTCAFSMEDPRGSLRQFSGGAIIDEVQRHSDLLSYLQGVVDASGEMGQFILTGSSQFELMECFGLTQLWIRRVPGDRCPVGSSDWIRWIGS
jgi:predicted AAA+ superfamily ATPase